EGEAALHVGDDEVEVVDRYGSSLAALADRSVCEHVFVRWDNLTIEQDESARLPGHRDPATIRRLDAPEALDMRFYEIHANPAIPTLDAKAWRATEPHTPHPRARLEAVAELNRAGIPTGVLVAPLMPGINDAPEQLEPLLEAIAEAGATGVGGIALHLRGDVRKLFFDWPRAHRPELVPLYEQLYARGAYAPVSARRRLAGL